MYLVLLFFVPENGRGEARVRRRRGNAAPQNFIENIFSFILRIFHHDTTAFPNSCMSSDFMGRGTFSLRADTVS